MRTQTLTISEKGFWVLIGTALFVLAWLLSQVAGYLHVGSWRSDASASTTGHEAHAHETNGHQTHGHEHTLTDDRLKHGKPGSSWYLLSAPIQNIGQGAEQQITLSLNTGGNQGQLEIVLEHENGVALLDTDIQQSLVLTDQRQVDIPVTVYAAEQGEHLVHLITHFTDASGNRTSRALSTAIRVDVSEDAVAQERNERRKSAASRDFITLKAQETIY